VLLLVIIVGLWELLTAVGILDAFFISSPSRIVNQLVEFFKTGEMWHHIGITLYETLAGFIIATAIGTFIRNSERRLDAFIILFDIIAHYRDRIRIFTDKFTVFSGNFVRSRFCLILRHDRICSK
jgi:hypothetical protein